VSRANRTFSLVSVLSGSTTRLTGTGHRGATGRRLGARTANIDSASRLVGLAFELTTSEICPLWSELRSRRWRPKKGVQGFMAPKAKAPSPAKATPRASARPTKGFFVRMLTRDISLEDCILDLIDNSIDAAWKASGERPVTLTNDSALAPYRISVQLSGDRFVISDNCTGITLDDAINYAFTFGRVDEDEPDDYSVGVYGIGMKRAVFKIGSRIQVQSTFQEKPGRLVGFSVPIDVQEWLKSDTWDFDLNDRLPEESVGVTIDISDLLPETKELFDDDSYERSLRRTLGRDYMVPLMRGLRIDVNGSDIDTTIIELAQNEAFVPMRAEYDDNDVHVEILAGMVSAPPDDSDADVRITSEETYGWYVACNGRMILAADRSQLTGWGELVPMWHKQYNGFVGLIFFSSENPVLLPMTTTKRSVDASSAVFRRSLGAMSRPTRAWIDYTNARKSDLPAAKAFEADAEPTPITLVAHRPAVTLPTVSKTSPVEPVANVNYSVSRQRMKALAAALGSKNLSHRDVGLKSFDFAYEELVDED
jgi:hypothetical protein